MNIINRSNKDKRSESLWARFSHFRPAQGQEYHYHKHRFA